MDVVRLCVLLAPAIAVVPVAVQLSVFLRSPAAPRKRRRR